MLLALSKPATSLKKSKLPSFFLHLTSLRIECIDTNFGTSTTMLLETLQNMTSTELGEIKWLVINQNDGINEDDLVGIMALLVNLERLSLNSNNMWYVFFFLFSISFFF